MKNTIRDREYKFKVVATTTKNVELKPFEDSRVYYLPYTNTFDYPTEEHIKGAKDVLGNPKEVYTGLFYDEFYDKNSDVYKDVQRGVRLI